ncbi:uncharacterized protein [Panulirus ornatus]|uniref:uncharacterized protein n=1 Tax=Panulirus ornatus TaxID=150431 RepID=UPI003A86611A
MKVLVLFALVAYATAKPQYLWPHTTPLVTVKSTDVASPIIPYAGLPWTHGLFPFSYPMMAAAKPAEERAKRSAEADPEADPFLLYSAGTYPYTGYPWAYNTFPHNWAYGMRPLLTVAKPAEATRAKRSADAEPEADPFLLYSAGTYPYTGYPWAYNTFPHNWAYGMRPLLTAVKPAEASRAKRSADAEPEADPFLLYSAGTYPYTGYPWAYNTFPYNWPHGINRLV